MAIVDDLPDLGGGGGYVVDDLPDLRQRPRAVVDDLPELPQTNYGQQTAQKRQKQEQKVKQSQSWQNKAALAALVGLPGIGAPVAGLLNPEIRGTGIGAFDALSGAAAESFTKPYYDFTGREDLGQKPEGMLSERVQQRALDQGRDLAAESQPGPTAEELWQRRMAPIDPQDRFANQRVPKMSREDVRYEQAGLDPEVFGQRAVDLRLGAIPERPRKESKDTGLQQQMRALLGTEEQAQTTAAGATAIHGSAAPVPTMYDVATARGANPAEAMTWEFLADPLELTGLGVVKGAKGVKALREVLGAGDDLAEAAVEGLRAGGKDIARQTETVLRGRPKSTAAMIRELRQVKQAEPELVDELPDLIDEADQFSYDEPPGAKGKSIAQMRAEMRQPLPPEAPAGGKSASQLRAEMAQASIVVDELPEINPDLATARPIQNDLREAAQPQREMALPGMSVEQMEDLRGLPKVDYPAPPRPPEPLPAPAGQGLLDDLVPPAQSTPPVAPPAPTSPKLTAVPKAPEKPSWQQPTPKNVDKWKTTVAQHEAITEPKIRQAVAAGGDEAQWRAHYRELEPSSVRFARQGLEEAYAPRISPKTWTEKFAPGAIRVEANGKVTNVLLSMEERQMWKFQSPAERQAALESRALGAKATPREHLYTPPKEAVSEEELAQDAGIFEGPKQSRPGKQLAEFRARRAAQQPPTAEEVAKQADRAARQDEFHRRSLELVQAHTPVSTGKGRLKAEALAFDEQGRPHVDMGQRRYFLTDGEAKYYNDMPPDVDRTEWLKQRQFTPKPPRYRAYNALPEGQAEIPETAVDALIPEGSPIKGKPVRGRGPVTPEPTPEPERSLVDEFLGEPAREGPRQAPDEDTGILETVDPSSIKTDAKTYQYKSGADASGVTGRLKSVEGGWKRSRSGKIVVHERLNGERFVADGHQRHDLAMRAQQAGQPNVQMDAMVYREADGWTPEDIRLLAAQKNMAEDSGTAIDAAKIIKMVGADHPDIKSLPRTSKVVRDGVELAKLSPRAFEEVVNELVSPELAAHVGRYITDPAEQVAAMRTLKRLRPADRAEAESIVQDIKMAGFARKNEGMPDNMEQGGLFEGFDEVEDLLSERAQVMAATAKRIKEDKALFNKLVKGEGRATEAGNKLDRVANEARLSEDDRILRGLQESKYVGAVNDALNSAARQVRKGGKSLKSIIDDFSETVGKHLEGGAGNRGQARGAESLDAPGAGPRAGLDFEPDAYDGPPATGWDSHRAPEKIGKRTLTAEQKAEWPDLSPAERRKMMGLKEAAPGPKAGLDFEQGDLFDAYEVHGTQVQLGGKNVKPLPLRAWARVVKDLTGKFPDVDKGLRALGKELGGFAKGRTRGAAIALNPDLFKNLEQAAFTLSHEIGHLPQMVAPGALPKEGVLADLVTLRRSMQQYYAAMPDDVVKELWNVTNSWRPFDEARATAKYKAYRRTRDEMFADAISMLMNDPKQLEKIAPKFYANLMKQMEQQPRLQQVMADLQNWRSGNLNDLDEGIRQRIATGMLKPQELMEAVEENAKLRKHNVMERIRQQVVALRDAVKRAPVEARMKLDVGAPLKDTAARMEKAGKLQAGSDIDARVTWDEYHYGTPEVALDSYDWQKRTLDPLDAAGVDENTFDKWMLYDGVSNSRGKAVAFPEGIDPDFADDALAGLRKDLSPDQIKALKAATKNARDLRLSALTDLHEAGMLSAEDFKRLKADSSGHTPSAVHQDLRGKTDFIKQIREEVGTLDEANMSPSVKLLMQNVEMRKLAHENKARKRVVDLYRLEGPLPEKAAPGLKPFKFWEDGVEKTVYVDPYVDELFARLPTAQKSSLTGISGFTDKLFRAGFITYSSTFSLRQLPKDLARNARNLASSGVANALTAPFQAAGDFIKGAPRAWRYAKGDLDDPLIRQAIKEKAIPMPEDSFLGEMRGTTEKMIAGLYNRSRPGSSVKRNKLIQGISKAWETWWDFTQAVEVLPKLSAQERLQTLSKGERAAITRDLIGTPNTRVKGEWTNQTHGLFMFANVIMQGLRSDLRVMAKPRSRVGFILQSALASTPGLLYFAAQNGWLQSAFGPSVKEFMDRVPEDVKRDKYIIPLGFDDNGKAVYRTVPKDDFNKHLGAVLWNALTANEDYAQKNVGTWAEGFVAKNAAYAPDVVPGLSPSLADAGRWMQVMGDQTDDIPEDDFGRPILSQNEMLAGGWKKWRGMLRYQTGRFGQVGRGIRAVAFEDDRPVAVSSATSWIPELQVSDFGLKQKERKLETAQKRKDAQRKLGYSRETRNVLGTYASLQRSERDLEKMGALGYREEDYSKRTEAYALASQAHKFWDSMDEQIAYLQDAGDEKGAAELRQVVDEQMATYDKDLNALTGKKWR